MRGFINFRGGSGAEFRLLALRGDMVTGTARLDEKGGGLKFDTRGLEFLPQKGQICLILLAVRRDEVRSQPETPQTIEVSTSLGAFRKGGERGL